MLLDDLNTSPEDRAVAELLRCCGSTRWAQRMAAARPFASFDATLQHADAIWWSLAPDDWLEAFRSHPRIGESARDPGEPRISERRVAASGGSLEPKRAGVGPHAPEKSAPRESEKSRAASASASDAEAEAWPEQEQAGVRSADAAVRDRLAEANRHYEARFGYIFIVCATGKSAAEMLAALERRLVNDPDTELRTAAEEQRRITRLRIEKLLAS